LRKPIIAQRNSQLAPLVGYGEDIYCSLQIFLHGHARQQHNFYFVFIDFKVESWNERGQCANHDKFYEYVQTAQKITLWEGNELHEV
jgi:hypothetical protein